jgi:ATP-dependent Clp protease adapter protein ClpS
MDTIKRYLDIVREAETLDREKVTQREEVPLHVPGGATVVVLNDHVTPFEVAVEAVMAATGLSQGEATKRMMKAHTQGWAAVAAYANRDVAETIAEKIMQHARSNDNYDRYRQYTGHSGPWPLHAEVMDAEQ